MFAADIVTVGFRDRAQRDLTYLSPAAHNDDSFPVDLLHGVYLEHLFHDRKRLQALHHGGWILRRLDFEVGPARFHDFHADDIALVRRDHAGELMQDAGPGSGGDFNAYFRHVIRPRISSAASPSARAPEAAFRRPHEWRLIRPRL